MTELNCDSFEISELKIGSSWKKYNLSEKWLNQLQVQDLQDLLSNDYYVFDNDEQKVITSNFVTKEELINVLNKQLLHFHKPENFSLFWIVTPNLSKKQKEFYNEDNFSESVITSLTHWTYNIPSDVRQSIKDEIHHNLLSEKWWENLLNMIKSDDVLNEVENRYSQFLRILKNYSDFWTRHLVKHSFIPESTVVRATKSRWITDPARAAWEVLKKDDFCNNVLPSALFEWVEEWSESYKLFHKLLRKLIDKTIEGEWWVTLVDDHDTWATCTWRNVLEDSYKTWGFPLINLWVKDWSSCNSEIVNYYAQRIEYHLWVKPTIDKPYKGWFVTTHYWKEWRENITNEWGNPEILNVIQQEVWKYLYLDWRTQKLDFEKVKIIGEWLARAKADLWRKFWKEYYAAVNHSEWEKTKYLNNYKEII